MLQSYVKMIFFSQRFVRGRVSGVVPVQALISYGRKCQPGRALGSMEYREMLLVPVMVMVVVVNKVYKQDKMQL